jgi:hypothetical protein
MTGIYGDEMGSMDKTPYSNGHDVIDIPSDDDGYQYPPCDIPDVLVESAPAPPQPPVAMMNSQEIDFSNCEPEEQISTLEILIIKKNYDIAVFPKPMAEFNEKNRISLFRKLISMPDAMTVKPIDVPAIESEYTDEVPF